MENEWKCDKQQVRSNMSSFIPFREELCQIWTSNENHKDLPSSKNEQTIESLFDLPGYFDTRD